MKKTLIVSLLVSSAIIIIIGIILFSKNNNPKSQNSIEIIDATYMCNNSVEEFYQDDKYIYSFPCVKSNSVYVKFKNGNKMLVIDALTEKKVTIDQLIDAGLKIYKKEK